MSDEKVLLAPLEAPYDPLPWQRDFHRSKARFRIACVGRRGGKSEAALQECVEFAYNNPDVLVWWTASSYDQSIIGFEKFLKLYPPNSELFKTMLRGKTPLKRQFPYEIRFHNGSKIQFRSVDRPDSLRGRGVHKLVCDEAALYPDNVWHEVLGPILLDTGGDAMFLSSPQGKNWFHTFYMLGQNPDEEMYESFHATSYDNTSIPDELRIPYLEDKRRNMPEREFRQEYLAEFLEDASDVFRNVKNQINPDLPLEVEGQTYVSEAYNPKNDYIIGVDVAEVTDFSVFVVLKLRYVGEEIVKQIVYLERVNKLAFNHQVPRLIKVWKDYGESDIIIDATGRGSAFVEILLQTVPPAFVTEVVFTGVNKSGYIQRLAADLDHERLTYPDIPVLINELLTYGFKKTASGHIKYGSPNRKHDDTVIALALAVSGAKERNDIYSLNSYQRAALLGF